MSSTSVFGRSRAVRSIALRSAIVLLGFTAAGAVGALGSLVASPLTEGDAQAKSSTESPYTYEQTWNAALRLVRVDLGFKVSEKDEKNGYIMFDYTDRDHTAPGSIELYKSGDTLKVVCQIPQFPSYHEGAVLTRLTRKLRDEYGTPPDKPKPPPVVVDAGGDGAPDGESDEGGT